MCCITAGAATRRPHLRPVIASSIPVMTRTELVPPALQLPPRLFQPGLRSGFPPPLPLPLVERPSRIGTLWRPFWAPTWADGPAWTAGARRHAPGGGREAPRGRVLGAKAWGREGGVLAMYWEGSGYVLGRVWLRTRSDLSTYWEGLSFRCLILVSHRYISFVYPKELPQYTY